MDIRRKIFEIIQPYDGKSRLSMLFDCVTTALILASVVMVFASTFDLSPRVLKVLSIMESVVSVVFTFHRYSISHNYRL